MLSLRAFLLPMLIGLMTLTGVGIGMARGAMASNGLLCAVTGAGPVILAHDGLPLFDAAGEAIVLDRSVCLDCQIVAFALPDWAADAATPVLTPRSLTPSVSTPWQAARRAPAGLARAPPGIG